MNPKSNTANSIDNLATRNSSDLAYTGIKKKYIDLTSLSK